MERDPEAKRLANAIRDELTAADWQTLVQWFRAAKLDVIYTAGATDDVDTTDLPFDSGMIAFVEVFPWGGGLDFPFQNRVWAVR